MGTEEIAPEVFTPKSIQPKQKLGIMDSFIEMVNQPNAAERLYKLFIVGLMGIFLIIFLIYAAAKLLGF